MDGDISHRREDSGTILELAGKQITGKEKGWCDSVRL